VNRAVPSFMRMFVGLCMMLCYNM